MKLTVFFAFFTMLLIKSQVVAQTLDSPKFTIGFSGGMSFPFGNFKKSDSLALINSNKYQGYAREGWDFNVKAAYRLTKHFGVMIQVGGDINRITSSGIQESNGSSTLDLSSETSLYHYYIGSYIIGPFLDFNINNKFEIGIHGLFGLMTINYSDIIYDVPGAFLSSSFRPDASSTLACDFGATIKWKLTKHFNVILESNYLFGTPSFTSYNIYSNYFTSQGVLGPYGHFNTSKEKMSTELLNINMGVGFSFW
jgi:hypothetical protein